MPGLEKRTQLIECINSINEIYDLSNNTTLDIQNVSKVVVILSSSRGGSSLLYELLMSTKLFIGLDGEHTPYYKLGGACFPYNGITSDEISEDQIPLIDLRKIQNALISDLHIRTNNKNIQLDFFIEIVARKIYHQWPTLLIEFTTLKALLAKIYKRCESVSNGSNLDLFHLNAIKSLNSLGYPVYLSYYDLNNSTVIRSSPPNRFFCLEEPPFIAIKHCRRPSKKDYSEMPVLLKASIDVYRLPLLRYIFPNADLKFIHLTRNPAASVNGLVDGWVNGSFFSHNVGVFTSLSISDYSDVFDWGEEWWKFDLPPKWQSVKNNPILQVCGFQWKSAHSKVLSRRISNELVRIKFEDLLGTLHSRKKTIHNLLSFIGVSVDSNWYEELNKLPIVMATSKPQNNRWRSRKVEILNTLQDDVELQDIAVELGYQFGEVGKWI